MDIKIIVAAHRPFWMPQDSMYLPLQMGRVEKEDIGYAGDDTGDNISEKNSEFSELTGLYWAWKNLQADYIGLVHYRRHFSVKRGEDKQSSVLTRSQLEPILRQVDVVVPKKRRYYIETIYSHYAHTNDGSHLDMTRQIIAERCPEYLGSFDRVMNMRGAHMFNMLIMKRELLDRYCSWLFDILFELEKRVDTVGMTPFEARLFGRVSERLLDVWLLQNHIPYKEIRCIHMEPENWFKKIWGFLEAKFTGKKYRKSM